MANPKKGASKAAQQEGPQTEFESRVSADDLRWMIDEAFRIKDNAATYVGQLGQFLKNQSERLGLTRSVAAQLLKLHRMESGKRTAYYRELYQGGVMLGHFDQIDAFDDLTVLAQRMAKKAEANTETNDNGPEGAAATLASLRVVD